MSNTLENKISEKQAIEFSRCVYGGTTYSHKMKLVAWNDKYVLMQKPPSTEYIGRMSGNVYAESEWMLVGFDVDKREVSHSPKSVAAFYKIGKLSKEDKKLLVDKYKVIFPKKEIQRKVKNDIWVIVNDKSSASWGSYRENCFKLYKLIKYQNDSVVLENNKGVKCTLSRFKYHLAYFLDSKIALNEFLKLERLAKEYNELKKSLSAKGKEICDIFSMNKDIQAKVSDTTMMIKD